jgi:hypothetical protein
MNPRIAGRPGEAVASAAEQTASVADFGMQVAERIQKAQDAVTLQDAGNSIDADIEQAHSGLANWTDYGSAGQMKQDTATALHEKYEEKYGNRPDLWRHIQNYLSQGLNSYDKQVDVKAADLTAKAGQAGLIQFQRGVVNKAATEPTLDGKNLEWAIGDGQIDLMAANGIINSVQAESAKVSMRSNTIATEVERAANPMNAPEVMEAELARLKEYEGKGYIDPEEIARMQAHMGEAYKVALDRSERVDVSKQGDAVLSSLKADPTLKDPETREFDHMQAVKKIDDDPNVPTKVKKYVRQELEEEAGAVSKLNNDRDQKMLDDLDPHVESGQLTFAEITRRENLAPGQKDWIPRRVADHMLTRAAQIQRENRVVSMQERGMMRQERMDNSADIRDQLLSDPGLLSDQNELTPFRIKGLSRADANIVWKVKGINADPGWANAVSMFKSSSLYDTTTDEGKAKLSKDLIGFAKTVENKKLTGAAITDELYNELHPKEEAQHNQTVKTLLDNIWPIARNVFSGGRIPLYGMKYPAESAQAPQRPKSVPENAVWNGEAKQWQLPPQ